MVGGGPKRQGTRRYSLTVVYLASPEKKDRMIGPELRAWAEGLVVVGVDFGCSSGKC